MTNQGSAAGRAMARRLLAGEPSLAADAAGSSVAMQRASAKFVGDLRRSVGPDGVNALLARALMRTQADQPALEDVGRADGDGIQLDVARGVEHHGAATVHAALESLFAAVVDILTELIGADMVANLLLEPDFSRRTPRGRDPS